MTQSPVPNPQSPAPFYISDLDGTLLRSDETIDPAQIAKLNQLIEAGVLFTVASARSHTSIRQVAHIDLKLPIIEANGAFVTDFVTGKHLLVNALESAVAIEIYALACEHGYAPLLTSFDGTADNLTYTHGNNNGTAWYINRRQSRNDPRLRQRDDMRPTLAEEVVNMIIISDEDTPLRKLHEIVVKTYGDKIIAYINKNEYSDAYWLVVHDQSATKATAIKSLQKQLGLTKHEVVVFGDQVNDLPMFQAADRAYAVENAVDVLKEKATDTIGHHNDGAVVDFIAAEQEK